ARGRGGDGEHGYYGFLAQIITLPPAGFGVGEEARHVQLGVVRSHRKAARLEMPVAVRIVGDAVAHIGVANDSSCRRIDHGDGVLAAVSDEDAQAVRRTDDVPWLGAGR